MYLMENLQNNKEYRCVLEFEIDIPYSLSLSLSLSHINQFHVRFITILKNCLFLNYYVSDKNSLKLILRSKKPCDIYSFVLYLEHMRILFNTMYLYVKNQQGKYELFIITSDYVHVVQLNMIINVPFHNKHKFMMSEHLNAVAQLIERSLCMRKIGVRFPVATDLSR